MENKRSKKLSGAQFRRRRNKRKGPPLYLCHIIIRLFVKLVFFTCSFLGLKMSSTVDKAKISMRSILDLGQLLVNTQAWCLKPPRTFYDNQYYKLTNHLCCAACTLFDLQVAHLVSIAKLCPVFLFTRLLLTKENQNELTTAHHIYLNVWTSKPEIVLRTWKVPSLPS